MLAVDVCQRLCCAVLSGQAGWMDGWIAEAVWLELWELGKPWITSYSTGLREAGEERSLSGYSRCGLCPFGLWRLIYSKQSF